MTASEYPDARSRPSRSWSKKTNTGPSAITTRTVSGGASEMPTWLTKIGATIRRSAAAATTPSSPIDQPPIVTSPITTAIRAATITTPTKRTAKIVTGPTRRSLRRLQRSTLIEMLIPLRSARRAPRMGLPPD